MNDNLKELLRQSRTITMTEEQQAQQRRSFAYGNTKIENDRITRELIADLDKKLHDGK
ncbi:MAG TPA: hypothetical protein VII49_04435 [Rhizomicrobium sp.]